MAFLFDVWLKKGVLLISENEVKSKAGNTTASNLVSLKFLGRLIYGRLERND